MDLLACPACHKKVLEDGGVSFAAKLGKEDDLKERSPEHELSEIPLGGFHQALSNGKREMDGAKVGENCVVDVVANEWKDESMHIKPGLKDQKFLQAFVSL
ncbi:hypothetical protein MKW98_003296 [Papaver atlanticum]|uniref:Uncharacterized protein n=1 Tax=Papaver atlanticum TaxID=357466 RepID=A0AAD4TB28_9MAGN|nr:hypothetical protein MKW98_003296 [Papaver atlanticum]